MLTPSEKNYQAILLAVVAAMPSMSIEFRRYPLPMEVSPGVNTQDLSASREPTQSPSTSRLSISGTCRKCRLCSVPDAVPRGSINSARGRKEPKHTAVIFWIVSVRHVQGDISELAHLRRTTGEVVLGLRVSHQDRTVISLSWLAFAPGPPRSQVNL